jgi:hypothetical protein
MFIALIRIALVVLWLPCAAFWLFASWRAKLRARLQNELAADGSATTPTP